jgi:hypothetical protein
MPLSQGSARAFAGFSLLVVSVIVSLSAHLDAQVNTTVGTWKLNVAKSKYSPGPPPKSEMRIYEPFGDDGIKATFNRVDAAGNKVTISYSAMYDGKDYKYTGSPDADTIALTKVDANTVAATLKKNGKVVITTKAVVSPDGKTRTIASTGTDAKGQKFDNVTVFERQ